MYRKQFLSLLADLSAYEGWRAYDAMSAFLTCAYAALSKPTLPASKQAEREAEYMAVVKRCQKPRETMDTISKMFGIVTQALTEETADFIGPVFMETSASDHMGQFFTPDSVCRLMAEITLSEAPAVLARQSHIRIDEPAAGAGAMILACCRYLKQRGINYQERVSFRLTDLDHDAFMAAYVQLSLAGVPAQVIHGNTLTLETRRVDYTPLAFVRPHLLREPRVKESVPPIPVQTEGDGQLVIDWGCVA